MDFQQYILVLRERWRSILLITLLGMLAAAGLAWSQTPMYSASTQLFVSSTGADNLTSAYNGSQFDQSRVVSYAKIVRSPDVISRARSQLGLTQSVQSLQNKVSASAPLNTVLLDISVTDASPALAQSLANAVGAAFSEYVNQLETPQGVATSPIKATTTQPASLPGTPVSPKKGLDLSLGLLIGLALGVGLAVARHQLDTRVKFDTDVEALTGGPLLVTVDDDPTVVEHPTIYTGDAFGARAEAFRTLRTNLSFVSAAEGARRIAVSSALPGDGKTSSAVNLAVAYAQTGRRVLIIDADLRRPTVATQLGLNPALGLTSVLVDPSLLPQAVQRWQPDLTLDVIASGPIPPNPSELLGGERMRKLLETVSANYDVVICDTPPLVPVTDAAVLAAHVDGVVLVTRVGKTRKEQLRHASRSVTRSGATVLGVVLNRAPRKRAGGYYYTYGYSYRSHGSAKPATSRRKGRKAEKATVTAPVLASVANDAVLHPPVGVPVQPVQLVAPTNGHLASTPNGYSAAAANGNGAVATLTAAAAVAPMVPPAPPQPAAPVPTESSRPAGTDSWFADWDEGTTWRTGQ